MKACIFAQLPAKKDLERGFYSTDVRILRERFDEVVLATSPAEVPRDCDLYLAWWWTTGAFPIFLSAIFGAGPVVITGNFDFDSPPKGTGATYVERPWWQRWVCRIALSGAFSSVFLSDDECGRIPLLLPTHNPVRVYLSVDLDRLQPGTGPRESFILNVAWSGEMNARRKCLFEIIEAFPLILEENPGMQLLMAGFEGGALPAMKLRARDLGVADRVHFVGTIDGDTLVRLMQKCCVYLSPTRHEGFGLALAEAMACGAPVVTSDRGAVREAVGDAAILVEPEPESISRGVNELLANSALRDDLSIRGRERVVRLYPYARRAQELGTVIESAMNTSRGRRNILARVAWLIFLTIKTAPLVHRLFGSAAMRTEKFQRP